MPTWEQVKALFEGLMDLPPLARPDYLNKVCGDDASLRAELERLMNADDNAKSFMKDPAVTWTAPAARSSLTAFSAGQKVAGRFRIVRFLGEGGMGQVYQAEDEVLGGFVALKTVRPEIASDQQTFERFKQEVRLAKEVTDENVCRVFDLDHQNAPPYITMELVEGETLSTRLRREGKMPAAEALQLVEQMAHGLAAAHQKGIIHRDFKPGNVMLARTPGGGICAKVTDFGLARSTGADSSIDPSKPIGTPPYMAPEQLEGGRGTVASDIYALGLVMYEMVTGEKPEFQRITEPAPSPRISVPDLDPKWEQAILGCLERDPARRFSSAIRVVEALRGETARSQPSTADLTPADDKYRQEGGGRRWLLWLLACGLLVAVGMIGYSRYHPNRPPLPFQNPQLTRITSTGNIVDAATAISPDGRFLAYAVEEAGKQSLSIKNLASASESRIVEPLDIKYTGLTFSRDGDFLYYVRKDANSLPTLYRLPTMGGLPRRLIVDVSTRSPVTFSPDGQRLAFVRGPGPDGQSAVLVANADGTGERRLTTRKDPDFLIAAAWSPDGRIIACAAELFQADAPYTSLFTVPAQGGPEKLMTLSHQLFRVTAMAWHPSMRGMILASYSQPSLPVQIWHLSYPQGQLRRLTSNLDNYYFFTLTGDGKALAVADSRQPAELWVAPGAPGGRARRLTTVAGGGWGLSWTPDKRIVYSRAVSGRASEIWITAADGSNPKSLTSDGQLNWYPRVSHDGRYVVFTSDRAGFPRIWRTDIDGGNPAQLSEGKTDYGSDFSPDGKWVIYRSLGGKDTLWKVPIDGGLHVRIADMTLGWPSVSPDGRFVAFNYDDSRVTPARGIAIVSLDSGNVTTRFDIAARVDTPVLWSASGNALLYVKDQGDVSNIWYRPLSNDSPRQLTQFATQQIFWFDVSYATKEIACFRGNVSTDVVLIRDVE